MKKIEHFPENIKGKKVLIISEDCSLSEGFLSYVKKFNASSVICNFRDFEIKSNELLGDNWDIIIFHPFSLDSIFIDKEVDAALVETSIKTFFSDFVPMGPVDPKILRVFIIYQLIYQFNKISHAHLNMQTDHISAANAFYLPVFKNICPNRPSPAPHLGPKSGPRCSKMTFSHKNGSRTQQSHL